MCTGLFKRDGMVIRSVCTLLDVTFFSWEGMIIFFSQKYISFVEIFIAFIYKKKVYKLFFQSRFSSYVF